MNGNWEDEANWSNVAGGAGGAQVPGTSDDVLFGNGGASNALIKLNNATSVHSLLVQLNQNIRFYTAQNISLTITGDLTISEGGSLKDSTSTDVAFRVIFAGSTNATGNIYGSWTFEGGAPVAADGSRGAYFVSEPGAYVKIYGKGSSSAGWLVFRQNTGFIVSDESSLAFDHGSTFLLERVTNGFIPNAFWVADQTTTLGNTVVLVERGATIRISGSIDRVSHLGQRLFVSAFYQYVEIDLPMQAQAASLDIPHDFNIKNLLVSNTNNQSLALLAPTGAEAEVYAFVQALAITGNTTRLTLARGFAGEPTKNYRLNVYEFRQSAGNFSLQDFNDPLGTTVLGVRGDLIQTGGTFTTNSTSTSPAAHFVVEMNGPDYVQSQSGFSNFRNNISMSSGTIDNSRHMVTLRMAQTVPEWTNLFTYHGPVNCLLQTPLTVGKLDLVVGSVYSTATNLLTVADPNPATNIKSGNSGNSYVNGPLRIATNSTAPTVLPVGKHVLKADDVLDNDFTPGYHIDSCVIIPASAAPSFYQAEYFDKPYDDSIHLSGGLTAIDTRGYWEIKKISGSDASVRLSLHMALPGTVETNAIVVARYNGSAWTPEPGSVLLPGTAAAGVVTSKPLSVFGPFTFGVVPSAVLAVHFTNFTAKPDASGVQLNWQVAEGVSRFDVLRSAKGIDFENIGTVTGSEAQTSYRFYDAMLPERANYYKIRATEPDGSVTFSPVVSVQSAFRANGSFSLAPTLVQSDVRVRLLSQERGRLQVYITDMDGRQARKFDMSVNVGRSEQVLQLNTLPPGAYQASAILNGKKIAMVRFVKK